MIFLLIEFFNLVGEGNIGQKETAVLLVVVVFGLVLVSGVRKERTFEDRFKSRSPFLNKKR